MSQHADVVVLTETPRPIAELAGEWVRGRKEPDPRYPHVLRRSIRRGGPPWRVVLSRWPLQALDGDPSGELLRARVARPGGPFVLMNAHPDSPRHPARWRRGNAVVRRLAEEARRQPEPVVVAADLNGTPSGWRSRRLCRAGGLRRGKPLAAWGTFPAGLPGPLRVAIDDVWVGEAWAVTAWRLLPAPGSDHRGVVVDLALGRR